MLRKLISLFTLVALAAGLALAEPQPKGGGKKGAAKSAVAADQCIATTQEGNRCKRKAQPGSKYCWQHDPNRKKKGAKKA